ncbi:MAG: metallophosphoesterase [Clostridia bacterium]|nr:metallophosphoesterase [Clostridia bacterium]
MKILVISDSHGSVGPILTAIDREKPDVLIHLGDGLNDLADIKFDGKLFAARGNCDLNGRVKTMGKVEYNKQIILYMHGNEFDVQKNYEKMISFAKIQGADIVLFGHTHKEDYFTRDGIVFLNPGAIKDRQTGTYATITFKDNEKPTFKHHKLT